MDQSIPAAEANRSFSRLLREVRAGKSFVVTSHGKPVARIVPCGEAVGQAAWESLMTRLDSQRAIDPPGRRWTRDELYEG